MNRPSPAVLLAAVLIGGIVGLLFSRTVLQSRMPEASSNSYSLKGSQLNLLFGRKSLDNPAPGAEDPAALVVVETYVDNRQKNNIEAVLATLAADATIEVNALGSKSHKGHAEITKYLEKNPVKEKDYELVEVSKAVKAADGTSFAMQKFKLKKFFMWLNFEATFTVKDGKIVSIVVQKK
eukprot:gnl/MRDRNA2_/MRDRNA2_123207_c0_seq1.p1 gnl/MRDRNA2_/MRDRNA2_123207_c0~~gnl/MRDRNA2_/MRDRNA2_123207_c0_seq1.p1  ORF type:complete len:180 (-),score=53.05 gnl/MRDRNA2_/MRDRNA2_123207_c0_seq1:14-553(-)